MLELYIEERIRRAPPPVDFVVRGSTPVIAFGNARRARVATLGLNPSRVEFLAKNGQLLTGGNRRLENYESLGSADLSSAPSDIISKIADGCDQYFCKRPYKRWFNQLLPMLEVFKSSYYDGSACHLDLVQWATDPVWGKLDRPSQDELISDDIEFLRSQLQSEKLETLLINGASVWKQFQRRFGDEISWEELNPIHIGRQTTHIYLGRAFERIDFIAWSVNIQSSFGVSRELVEAIAKQMGYEFRRMSKE
jgi:hypothetical protein